jgi:hypothetical protein
MTGGWVATEQRKSRSNGSPRSAARSLTKASPSKIEDIASCNRGKNGRSQTGTESDDRWFPNPDDGCAIRLLVRCGCRRTARPRRSPAPEVPLGRVIAG